ncbi:MAG: ACP S-malonyltransferase [Methylococcales bacterium]|nr:ACP S-malonyltransferase [Methylococcales bacterium]
MGVAYLFPGQGSQYVGMGRDLYDREPAARAVFDLADEILGFPFSQLCFEGPEAVLKDTANQQPAIFVCSVAAWEAVKVADMPRPDYLAGHSLGEYSALVAAGSLSFEAALPLVRRRGQLMEKAGKLAPGAMAAIIALDVDKIDVICRQASEETGLPVQVGNDNCPGQVVISGHTEALERALVLVKEAGARKVIRLPISVAAHSPLMNVVSAEFSHLIADLPINSPQIPVISNLEAAPLAAPRRIRHELERQLTHPIRWTASIQYLLGRGVDTFIEVGPGNILSGLMKRIDRKATRKKFNC